jgi:hypothetical protein
VEVALHPLHSPDWVAKFVMERAALPGTRGTGRTTIGLLKTLVDALSNPCEPQPFIDHHFQQELARIKGESGLLHCYEQALVRMVNALGLREIRFHSERGAQSHDGWRPARIWICFGKPNWLAHTTWDIIRVR